MAIRKEGQHVELSKMKEARVGGGNVFFGDLQVYLVQDREKGS